MIRIVEDVGAPIAVTAIDMATLELVPAYNEVANYVMTAAGYLGGFFLRGRVSNFLASMGAASLPLTARAIYARVKQPAAQRAGTSRLAFRASRAIQSYPSQPQNTQRWPSAV